MDLSKEERLKTIKHLLCGDGSLPPDEDMYEIPKYIQYSIRGRVQLKQRMIICKPAASELKQEIYVAYTARLDRHGNLLEAYRDVIAILGRDIRRDPECELLPHRNDLVEMMTEYDIPLYMIATAAMLNARDYPPDDLAPLGVIDSPENTDKSMEHGDYVHDIEERLVDMERFDLLVSMELYQKLRPNAPTLPRHLAIWWKHP